MRVELLGDTFQPFKELSNFYTTGILYCTNTVQGYSFSSSSPILVIVYLLD